MLKIDRKSLNFRVCENKGPRNGSDARKLEGRENEISGVREN